jgi:hypothetical protein
MRWLPCHVSIISHFNSTTLKSSHMHFNHHRAALSHVSSTTPQLANAWAQPHFNFTHFNNRTSHFHLHSAFACRTSSAGLSFLISLPHPNCVIHSPFRPMLRKSHLVCGRAVRWTATPGRGSSAKRGCAGAVTAAFIFWIYDLWISLLFFQTCFASQLWVVRRI